MHSFTKSDIVHIAIGLIALAIWAFGATTVFPADLIAYAKIVVTTLGGSAAGIAINKKISDS